MLARARWLATCLLLAACGSARTSPDQEAAKVLAPHPVAKALPGEDVESISGTIASIRFQNINKARDHYTYNVELRIDRPDADPVTARVDKVYWWQTRQAVRDAIAPEGPKHELYPSTWREWTVGEPVQLRARMTSPALGWLVR